MVLIQVFQEPYVFKNGEVVDIIDMPCMADGKKNKRQINSQQVYNEISQRILNIPKKK